MATSFLNFGASGPYSKYQILCPVNPYIYIRSPILVLMMKASTMRITGSDPPQTWNGAVVNPVVTDPLVTHSVDNNGVCPCFRTRGEEGIEVESYAVKRLAIP